jgi:hypothetical protein
MCLCNVCMYVRTYVCVYVMDVCIYVCMYLCNVRMRVCMYVCMYVCMNEKYATQQWIVSLNSAFVLLTEPQQALIE